MKIEFKNISKSFNDVQVLKNVSFSIDTGIHALMGENGAGKSTLMKILTGLYQASSGEIYIDGIKKNYKHPKEAEKDGIVFIHQELNILTEMSVTDNIFLNKEIKKGIFVDQKEMNKKAKELLTKLGLDINVSKSAGSYSIGQQQIFEIAKALKEKAKVIIMDEPTAALSQKEADKLFNIIEDLKDDGITIIYISHRMEEVFKLCEKISVLRDGEYVATKNTSECNVNDIIKLMVGRDLEDIYPSKTKVSDEILLKVENISKKNKYYNVSFELKAGEILGVAGLMGAGRTEVMHGIFGSIKFDSGTVFVQSKKLINTIEDSIKNKIAFITEDRKNEGIITDFSINDNLVLTNFKSVSKGLFIDHKKQNKLSSDYIEMLNTKASGYGQLLKYMSGGNQQKIVISKWLNIDPKVLIMDEPTRGIDIGAKKEVYEIMKKLCEEKQIGIILVSSEMGEVIGMSNRVIVFHEKKISGILNGKDINQENIMKLATGGSV